MKIKKITKKVYDKPKKIYCFYEPYNNECIVVGKANSYASYQSVNFGFLFGRGALSFSGDIQESWSDEEVITYLQENNIKYNESDNIYLKVSEDIRNKFFETYPALVTWIKKCHSTARAQGYIDSFFNGRRHLPELKYQLDILKATDDEKKNNSHLLNIAVNSPVQNFEAVVVYHAMIKLHKNLCQKKLKSYIIGMVHDSIVLYVHKSELETLYILLKNVMEDYDSFDVPLLADVEYGDVWGFGSEISGLEGLNKFIHEINKMSGV